MPATDVLKRFGLKRNPFTDRTAEKSSLDETSLYIPSDLRGFRPSNTTYIFFGKRGSGKTTIRLLMEHAYQEYNADVITRSRSRGHFMVDLCRPGHMTDCLKCFQEAIKCTDENWDAQFSDNWGSADLVDCILSYSAVNLVHRLTSAGEDAKQLMELLKQDGKLTKQFLLLTHLYAHSDAATLAYLRAALLPQRWTQRSIAIGACGAAAAASGMLWTARPASVSNAVEAVGDQLAAAFDRVAPRLLSAHPRATAAVCGTATAGMLAWYYMRLRPQHARARAAALQRNIRVVKQQPVDVIADLINSLFAWQDSVHTIRSMYIGISAHQKLDLLSQLLKHLGFESLTVFGDCFDEVGLMDPVQYPAALKKFAQEVCRNDLLNFGRLHFFFPDSRLALDLSTDKTLKEARFDRHFVRDLTWSRHQLEELAERRFAAAQQPCDGCDGASSAAHGNNGHSTIPFKEVFEEVTKEDFSSIISQLQTPRELLIMMTEVFARLEASEKGVLSAQDMEIAVKKAHEQAV